jgi:hypothetical protein
MAVPSPRKTFFGDPDYAARRIKIRKNRLQKFSLVNPRAAEETVW